MTGDGTLTLTGNAKYLALHLADQGIRMQEVEAACIARGQEALEQKIRMQVNDDFMSKFVTGSLSMKDVLDSNLKPFGEGSKDTWLNMFQKDNAQGPRPVKTDPQWFQEVFQRIRLPEGDPNKTTNEDALNGVFGDGRVNRTDLDWLRKEFRPIARRKATA